ncbi:caspase family protein [Sulfitobacter faviae]|uniref:Caspase family protein n=1 Tax=Sulfitobacter faviae TaxID=1775881 RepID=A0ABZ0V0P9_9RHOB|nr:caspase family protein [Sulfitobacter faviae]WPZ22269.1 caspase family protein [Sulfitobacter faviae]
MKKALVVGIDNYPAPNQLSGCVNDAVELSALLESNGDGSPNFDVRRIISSEGSVTSAKLHEAIGELFAGDADTVLLYFAGHGIMDEETNNGFLVTQDGSNPNWGINLSGILQQANKAHPRIKSTVILLDSCQSGFAGEVSGLGENGAVSHIGNGVTILTACHRQGFAAEANGHGKFTDIMIDGLGGAASDVIGRVTPASLYAHVDQTLGAWEQRPIYKANVQSFISLREVSPKVPKEVLRRLPQYFPTASHIFKLDPSFEPDRGEEAENLAGVAVDDDNVRIYRELQKCHQHGLVTPTEHEFMWHSAVFSGGVRLTATGAHYRKLAEKKKI